MRSDISALLDGELDGENWSRTLDGLARDGTLRAAWDEYCLIGDAMRRSAGAGMAARVMDRIEREPTVLAPAASVRPVRRRARLGLALAASFAAVSAVGWLAAGRDAPPPTTRMASVAASDAATRRDEDAAARSAALVGPSTLAEAAVPPPTVAVMPYLVVHQGYGSAGGLQGVAQYVRVVSDTRRDAAR